MSGLVVKDTRREDVVKDPVEAACWCYLCGEAVMPGPDYTVHLTTAHEEVHVSSAIEGEEEGDVIEDPAACYLCGETVLPGQDYKVHLAAAHRMTKVKIE